VVFLFRGGGVQKCLLPNPKKLLKKKKKKDKKKKKKKKKRKNRNRKVFLIK